MDEFDYTDNDSDILLERLVKYAEAYAGDHVDPELTVKDLVNDLVDSLDEPRNEPRFQRHRDRIFAALDKRR